MAAHISGVIGRTLCALALAIVGGVAFVTLVPELATPLEPGCGARGGSSASRSCSPRRSSCSPGGASASSRCLRTQRLSASPSSFSIRRDCFAAQLAGVTVVLAGAGVGLRAAVKRLARRGRRERLRARDLPRRRTRSQRLSGPIGWIAAVVAVTVATAVELLLPRALSRRSDGGAGAGRTDGPPFHTPLAARGDRECRDVDRRARAHPAGPPGQVFLLMLPFVSCAAAVWATTSEHRRLVNLRASGRRDTPGARGTGPRRERSRAARSPARARRRGRRLDRAPASRRRETRVQVASTGPEGDSPLRACALRRDRAAGVRRGGARVKVRARCSETTWAIVLHGLIVDLGLRRAISIPLRGEAGVNGLLRRGQS